MPNTQMFLEGAFMVGCRYLYWLQAERKIDKAGENLSLIKKGDYYEYVSTEGHTVIVDEISAMWYARNVIGAEEAFKGCRLREKKEE